MKAAVELILRLLYWGILAAMLVGAVVVAFKLRRMVLGAKEHRELDDPTALAPPISAPDPTEDLRRLKREMEIDQADQ